MILSKENYLIIKNELLNINDLYLENFITAYKYFDVIKEFILACDPEVAEEFFKEICNEYGYNSNKIFPIFRKN